MMSTSHRLLPLAAAAVLLLAGCGTTPPRPSTSTPARVLTPTAVVNPPDTVPGGAPVNVQGNLTGRATDTLTISAPASGDGTLTLTAPSGRVLWRLPHVAWAGVLFFGKAHDPVIVVRSSPSYCGSGGCNYTGYTYAHGRFVAIPGAPSETGPTYAYSSAKHAFVPQVEPPTTAFFGFASLSRQHTFILSNRLYDALQHYSVQSFAIVQRSSGNLSWRESGLPSFGPDVAVPGSYTSLATAEDFLAAAAMRLPTQEASFAAASANLKAINATIDRAFPQPTDLAFDAAPFSRTAVSADGVARLIVANTSLTSLAAFRAVVDLIRSGATWQVSAVTLAPLVLKVRSMKEVLAVLAHDPRVMAYMRSHQGAAVKAFPESPTSWLVALGATGPSPELFALDAKTGRLGPPPYSSTP